MTINRQQLLVVVQIIYVSKKRFHLFPDIIIEVRDLTLPLA